MDEATARTIAAYAQHAVDYAKVTAMYDDYPEVARIMSRFEAGLARRSIVLDIGCGGGRESKFFAERHHRVIGVDLCAPLLHTWEFSTGDSLRVVADMRRLPLRNSSGDALVATSSVVHLPPRDLLPTLSEFGRVLAAGGVLLITVPIVDSSGWLTRESLPTPRWFTRIVELDLERALQACGFVDITFESTGSEWISVFARNRS